MKLQKDIKIEWIYVDNKNRDIVNRQIYKSRDNKYNHVRFYGPVTTLGDNWLFSCNNLLTVDFMGLDKLTDVGITWMGCCTQLLTINFMGLDKLISVGKNWNFHCVKLQIDDKLIPENVEKLLQKT